MKKLLLTVGLLGLASGAFAQGTLVFANLASGVNAPVTNKLTGVRLTTVNWMADLYFSNNTNAPTDSLQAAGFNVPFSTTTSGGGGGYFLGGTRTVTGAPGTIVAQVRVWDSQFGSTFELARANPNAFTGVSGTVLVNLAIPPAPAPPLTGLTSFGVAPIPEPTTFALAGLGAAALLLFRRRK
jgi:hypothetical protein